MPHLSLRDVGRAASGCFCLELGASAGLWGPVGLERDCRGEGQTVVRFPGWWGREPGGEAWQVAKAGNTQSLV